MCLDFHSVIVMLHLALNVLFYMANVLGLMSSLNYPQPRTLLVLLLKRMSTVLVLAPLSLKSHDVCLAVCIAQFTVGSLCEITRRCCRFVKTPSIPRRFK